MIKKIYFSETTIFASQGLRFGLRRCETTEPLKKGKLAGIFPELTSVILFPIGNPRWSSTKHEHIKKDPNEEMFMYLFRNKKLIESTWYMSDHWASDCCSMPSELFFRYIIMRQLYSDEMLMLSALY